MKTPLISVDVGGTLGRADEPSIAAVLAAASPLGTCRARGIMREGLHCVPEITDAAKAEVCAALQVPVSTFPASPTSKVQLFPGARRALRELSRLGTVVTLSNVTRVEGDTDDLSLLLGSSVSDQFPSWRLGCCKPDPRAFQRTAAAFGRGAEDMVHIGDDWECDVLGATGAGATAIWTSAGRAVPDDRLVAGSSVLVADDLADAVRHVRTLTTWWPS